MISNNLLKRKVLNHLITDNNYPITTLSKLVDKKNIGDGDWILSNDMCQYSNNKLIQLGSIGMGEYINKPFKYIDDDTFDRIKCSEINDGDLLLNRFISNNQLSACLVPMIDGRLLTSVDVCWIKEDKEKYINKYLMYCILSDDVQKKILLKSSGTTRIRISKSNLVQIPIPIPDISKQKEIVDKIDTIFELIDKKEKNDQEKIQLKKLLKDRILDSAIHGSLDNNNSSLSPINVDEIEKDIPFELPSNWRWIKMEKCFTFKQGVQIDVSLQKFEQNDDYPLRFLRIVDFTQNNSDIRYVSNEYKNWFMSKKEVAIVRYGASAGFICLGKEGVLANNLFKLIPKIDIDEKYTYYLLNSNYFQGKIRTHSVAMPALKFASLNKILLPIPPLEEQKRIVEKIESLFELIEQL